jgi:excisionase family DNA binding protein
MATQLLSLEAAAKRLGVTHWCLRRWLRYGKIAHHRLNGRTIRIREADLEALIDAARVEAHEDLALPGCEPSDDESDDDATGES